jgi:tetratricopeptide (TPR) repeat protein
MKRVLTLCAITLAIVLIGAFGALAQDDVLAAADAAYDSGDKAQINESIAALEAIMDGNEEATWRFARASYWVGVRTTDKAARKDIFEKSFTVVEKYFEEGSTNPATNYWYAVNAGQYGKLKGILKSLFLVSPMKEACNRVLKVDPGFEDGNAYTILGAIEYEVPGGDIDKCIEYSKKALTYDPDNITPNLYLAKAYYKQDKLADAKGHLEHILATANPKTASDKEDVAEAKELLEQVKADMGG